MFTDKKLPRREFLRISSVAIAGTAAATIVPAGGSLLAGIVTPSGAMAPLLSVGYVESAPQLDSFERLGSATSLSSGDPAFISRSARVVLTAFARHTKNSAAGSTFEVDAIYPARGYTPAKYPRFRAWLAISQNGIENGASGANFTLPITSDGGAQLLIRRLNADGKSNDNSPADEAALTLSAGVESGTLKLQRGIYVLAFRERAGEETPSWSSYRLANADGKLYIPSAPFSYVLMTIDYAE